MARHPKASTLKRVSLEKLERVFCAVKDFSVVEVDSYFVVKLALMPGTDRLMVKVNGKYAYFYIAGRFNEPVKGYRCEVMFCPETKAPLRLLLPWSETRNSHDWDAMHREILERAAKGLGRIYNWRKLKAYTAKKCS